jgi:hypothetical protein
VIAVDGFVWLHNSETGGYFRCPDGAVDDWREMGWEPSDPPEEVNPAIASRLALEREQAEAAQAAETSRKAATTKSTKSARRGESLEESES